MDNLTSPEFLTALAGLIIAITGLVAVILHRNGPAHNGQAVRPSDTMEVNTDDQNTSGH